MRSWRCPIVAGGVSSRPASAKADARATMGALDRPRRRAANRVRTRARSPGRYGGDARGPLAGARRRAGSAAAARRRPRAGRGRPPGRIDQPADARGQGRAARPPIRSTSTCRAPSSPSGASTSAAATAASTRSTPCRGASNGDSRPATSRMHRPRTRTASSTSPAPTATFMRSSRGSLALASRYATACTRTGCSKPFSDTSPRSRNARPLPRHSSATAFDTRLCSGCACVQRRAASCTVAPKRSS